MVRTFLRLPSVGGWLSIVNCLFWLGFSYFRFCTAEETSTWFVALVIFMSCPIAWPLMIPNLRSPTAGEGIFGCVWVGLNAFLWGYGLAAAIKYRRVILTHLLQPIRLTNRSR